ncbi:MAG: DUF5615 family PIN-like protein [Chloroflexota bacterium]|nr:DUF5615 family PIN-like protein [Chloroflexota bacterium]
MTQFYFDEDIPLALADLLRVDEHTVSTTRDEHQLGSSDPAQLLFAANDGLTLVTHNRKDFARLHEAWLIWARGWGIVRSHGGIIVLGRVQGKSPTEYAALLRGRLADAPVPLADTFHRWHPEIGWTQSP